MRRIEFQSAFIYNTVMAITDFRHYKGRIGMHTFGGLSDEERQLVAGELLRRAAQGYEQSGNWRQAAVCWAELGDQQRAGALYERGGDLEQAAGAWLEAGHYTQALALYQQWERHLLEVNFVARVQALLGQAACHHLGTTSHQQPSTQELSALAGQQAYQQARALLATSTQQDRLQNAGAWADLGDYGVLLDRYDLVQEGYERALQSLEERTLEEERRILQSYLAAARTRADRLLSQVLEERLADWEAIKGEKPSKSILRPFPVESLRVLHTLTSHTSVIWSVAIRPDGQTLVSGGNDTRIKVWNLLTGQEVRTLIGHTASVESVAISPDGQTLVSASEDKTIKIWGAETASAI